MKGFIKTLIIASTAIASAAVAEAESVSAIKNKRSNLQTVSISYNASGSVEEIYSQLKKSSRTACAQMSPYSGFRKIARCEKKLLTAVVKASQDASLISFHKTKKYRRRQSFTLASLF